MIDLNNKEDWELTERPGYFGKKRNELALKWTTFHGPMNWLIAWQWGDQIIQRGDALQKYEDAYHKFLESNPKILDWLITNWSEVYDTNRSNANFMTKFDYDSQETLNNHIHDISIRKAVRRLGKTFQGDKLLHVRGKGTEGEILSPHMVPFHMPNMIYQGEIQDYGNKGHWWRKLGIPDSVEEYYQQNKALMTRKPDPKLKRD